MTLSACRKVACVKTLGTVGEAYLNERPVLSLTTKPNGRLDNWHRFERRVGFQHNDCLRGVRQYEVTRLAEKAIFR